MRICFFLQSMSLRAGMERMVSVIANHCIQDPQIDISIVERIHAGPSAYTLDKAIKLYSLSDLTKSSPLQRSNISLCFKFFFFLRKHHFDKVIIVGDTLISRNAYSVLFPLLACKLFHIQTLVWEHFNCLTRANDDGKKKLLRPLSLFAAAKFADHVIVITHEDEALWRKYYHPKAQLICLPNMLDKIKPTTYNPYNKTIVAVGRLTHQKGFDLLLKIWRILQQTPRNKEWKIIFVGGSDPHLHQSPASFSAQFIKSCKKTQNVVLEPPTSDIASIYEQAGIFAFTSRREGFGLVLAEAQAYGVPAVSFMCHAGPSEIIANNKSGYLVPAFDIAAFAQALQKLMDNPQLREAFSTRARQQGELFSAQKLLPLWRKLLKT